MKNNYLTIMISAIAFICSGNAYSRTCSDIVDRAKRAECYKGKSEAYRQSAENVQNGKGLWVLTKRTSLLRAIEVTHRNGKASKNERKRQDAENNKHLKNSGN